MKQLVLAFLIIPFLALAGCSKDDTHSPSGGDGLSFAPDTKAVTEFSGWTDTDAIGIFMIKIGDQIDGTNTIKNKKYAYKTSKFLPEAVGERIILPKDGTQVDFVSYFPHQATLTGGYKVAVDVTNQAVEKSIDLLYSENAKGHSESLPAVSFAYKHALSKVMIVLKSDEYTAEQIRAGVTAIDLLGVPTTAKFDMKAKTFIDKGNVGSIALRAIAATDPAEFEAIVVPDKDRAGREIYFMFNSTSRTIEIDDTDDFQSGMAHTYVLKVGTENVVIEKIETIPWGDGGINPFPNEITKTFVDPVFRKWVQDTFCDGREEIEKSDLVNIKKVTFTKADLIAPKTIATLAGIEYFPNLEELILPEDLALSSLSVRANKKLRKLVVNNSNYYAGPKIKRLNLSGCPELTYLASHENLLTELDLSSNPKLDTVSLYRNTELLHLDFSNNPELLYLYIYQSKITELNMSNCAKLSTFYCPFNGLTSLNFSENTALTTLYCFYNELTSLNVSANTALTTLDCNNNRLTSLDVSNNPALTTLNCLSSNSAGITEWLTELDLSKNTALTTLDCRYNRLTELDLSKNTALTTLNCSGWSYSHLNLTELDLSKNTALTSLNCSYNQLTELDLSKNTALTNLQCHSNQLTSLNLSAHTALTTLSCSNNKLTILDVSKNEALTTLYCSNNKLTSLNLSANKALTGLQCYANKLTSLDLSSLDVSEFIFIVFYQNPGTGDGGSTPPVNFEVKLPSGSGPETIPSSAFPQSGQYFQWNYQFKDEAGLPIGSPFQVTTLYTNL